MVSNNGLFVSNVANGGGGGGGNLISNPGFESSLSTTSPWTVFATGMGGSSFEVTDTVFNGGSNSLALFSGTGLVALGQTISSVPGSTSMNLSFYGKGFSGGEIVRLVMSGDNCGGGSWTYNFGNSSWECANFNGASSSPYADDITLSNSFSIQNIPFTSLPSASSTGGITLVVVAGSSDSGAGYFNQTLYVDDFSLSTSGGGGQNVAFSLNATNFSPSSTNNLLLSLLDNGTEKFHVKSDGTIETLSGINTNATSSFSGLTAFNSNLLLNSDFVMSGNTNNLSFTTTTIFSNSVTGTAANAYIFDASNFSSTYSTGNLLSLRSAGNEQFSFTGNGIFMNKNGLFGSEVQGSVATF